ncbi:vesicle-associated membrane protein-associated protein A [Scaptodrosophila lebanonensis]|uniref:Vesicle-associated membrane protein-associated protein A n=1 Tax=Drosophila lebanonensis TaxID=7225 RepID=A0A6J2UAS3_DROLE|nr:vesicle-associated membrane protein-associated protein A [Scaptodrosophila lebanonensis]
MEQSKDNLLIVSPKILKFYMPYDRSQRRLLTMLNPTEFRLVFKVKANQQRHYNVTPNCGVIEPYTTTEVCISLNYFDFHPTRRYKHRFCVQCVRAPANLPHDLLDAFNEVERSELNNVRVPVQLNAKCVDVSDHQFTNMQFDRPDFPVDALRQKFRPLCPNCAQHMERTRTEKTGCNLGRKLIALLVLIGGIVMAYFQREQIHSLLKMDLEPTDVEF